MSNFHNCDKFDECINSKNCLLCKNRAMFKSGRGRRFETTVRDLRQKTRKSIASGAIWTSPADVYDDVMLIECKTTGKKSISIKKDWLEKIEKQAKNENKLPILVFEIDGLEPYAIIDFKIASSIIEYMKNKEGE